MLIINKLSIPLSILVSVCVTVTIKVEDANEIIRCRK